MAGRWSLLRTEMISMEFWRALEEEKKELLQAFQILDYQEQIVTAVRPGRGKPLHMASPWGRRRSGDEGISWWRWVGALYRTGWSEGSYGRGQTLLAENEATGKPYGLPMKGNTRSWRQSGSNGIRNSFPRICLIMKSFGALRAKPSATRASSGDNPQQAVKAGSQSHRWFGGPGPFQ
jgi:hypothetical protein